MSIRFSLPLFLLLSTLLMPVAGQAAPRYTVKIIGTAGSVTTDLNNAGHLVGQFQAADAAHAFLYDATLRDLGTLGGPSSTATAINNRGVVVGHAENADGNTRAFVVVIGTMFDIGTLGGPFSEAHDVSTSGAIVGGASTSDEFEGILPRAFQYQNGVMRNLYGFVQGDSSIAFGINNAGQVVGRSAISSDDPPEHPYHAFLYERGQTTDLGTLGGLFSTAYAINESGVIVGQASTAEMYEGGHFVPHAFVYRGGIMQDLGAFGGAQSASLAADINGRGQVVGYAETAEDSRAFLYENDTMLDLNTLIDPASGWLLVEAHAINERQQIAARGCKEGECYALLLEPAQMLPLPGSALLLVTGLILVGVLRCRRPTRDVLATT